tara:strand:- start:25 stop:357 length:333 start_codon:yes stop_codon:yes gene_type:complete
MDKEALLISLTYTGGLVFLFFSLYSIREKIMGAKSAPNIEPIIIKRESKMTNSKTVLSSIDLMKQEKQIDQRKDDLQISLDDLEKQKIIIQKSLQQRGWVKKLNGEWGFE